MKRTDITDVLRRRLLVAVALGLTVAGCAPKAPPLLPPDSVESFCAEKEPRGTAVDSILSSVADRIEPVAIPSAAALRSHLRADSGVIGHWKSQPLFMPDSARVLGVRGNYLDVRDVVITNDLANADTRIIYVTVATPAGMKRLALLAYDIQNVCVEGERLS